MARENKVLLNGQILLVRKIVDEDKKIKQILISLYVMRNPKLSAGNMSGELRGDAVSVLIRDEKNINYFEEMDAVAGDMMEVYGVFCTVPVQKKFFCQNCSHPNVYDGITSFVNPLVIRVEELTPKYTETLILNDFEARMPKKDILKLLGNKKTSPGDILRTEALPKDENGNLPVRITTKEKPDSDMIAAWYRRMSEISNRVTMIGNLCADPVFNTAEVGGKVCTYQLGINRKFFIKQDPAECRADYPWIRSLGQQAVQDAQSLHMGSSVYIEGSIQAKDKFSVKRICQNCGAENTCRGSAMEILPYYVEYLRNYTPITNEEETADHAENADTDVINADEEDV